MGILDLPAPALLWVDANLAMWLPSMARLVVWGSVAAAVSMALYWLLSPQQRMARLASEEQRLRVVLKNDDAEFSNGLAAAVGLLRLATIRVGLVLLPVMLAAVPVLCLMAWLQTHYGYELPAPDRIAAVTVDPATMRGQWNAAGGGPPRVDVIDDRGSLLQSVAISAPVSIIHKRAWWNALIGNPLGYLPDDGPIGRITIELPEKRYLAVGPDWARGWEAPFMTALLAASLLLKLCLRIH